ncbi:GGDEF domain-containing protein [Edaphobacter dinghuensis]|uniref:diguanylate cyclase n=1 Tax=Edaphobacter dinghuensis TaxID=1560005 RepID=A0A917HJZ1_9BACT|nr:GGDEF domain-containing protein [Edaphobacter dinghuensis]GGG81112.1 hypothetical protein GCM10011585_25700 [Edaphobacter dinghuensis]
MSLLSWIDNRTLIGCQILTSSVLALVFLGMKHTHPRLRGARTFSLGFAVGVVGCCLFIARGAISDLASVVLANALILSAFALFYQGLLRFFDDQRRIWLAFVWAVIALSVPPMIYYTLVHQETVPRIIICEAAIFPIRLLMTIELFRYARDRSLLKLFAAIMAAYTLMGVARVVLTLLYGSPADFMQRNLIQSSVLVINVILVCIIGLFFLLMLSGELMDALESQSFEDLVSGALNRRGIEQKLAIELGSAKRTRMAPSIALIDLDHFKAINDTQGHAAGDKALREVAHAISSRLRDYDYVGRYGGDEFLLVLPQVSYQDTTKIIERIQQAIRALPHPRPELPITLSIGVTQAVPFESAEVILARADAALYEAKRAGRNCCRVIPPTVDVEIPAAVTAPNNPS